MLLATRVPFSFKTSPFLPSRTNRFPRSPQFSTSSIPPVGEKSSGGIGRPLRRVLFNVPGNDHKKLTKATTLDLDCVVLDLEDGVATNQKEAARKTIQEFLTQSRFGKSERVVRINSIGSGLEVEDLRSLRPVLPHIDSILLPKCESAAHLEFINTYLELEGDQSKRIKILAAIESARGIIDLKDICRNQPRLDALIFASEDFCANTGITRTPGAQELLFARSSLVTHAVAFNLQAIDMVCIDFRDMERLKKEALEGAIMGYTGKQAIHPAQIQPIYEAFSPPKSLVELVTKIVEENAKHQAVGSGAFSFPFGERTIMVDKPMVLWAEGILKKAGKM